MSRGYGACQRFILDQLTDLGEDEWLSIQELANRYAKLTWGTDETPEPVDRTVRAACRRLAISLDPEIKVKVTGNGQGKRQAVQLTERGRLTPWAAKQRDMPDVWLTIRAEQSRNSRR